MNKRILEFIAAVGLTLAAILAPGPAAHANDVMVKGAFARASASEMAKSGAAYLVIANEGAEADQLVALATPAAASAMVHESIEADGVMKMVMRDTLDIPAGATVTFKPGGLHVMLMGLAKPLKEGESFPLDLTFAKAGHVTVTVPVEGVAAQGPGG